ncbi:MAG: hypothetical protein OEV43_08400 [Coriobacteriia bacterium]|nr:hypothetical protein [Coriobacteriia bacterium]
MRGAVPPVGAEFLGDVSRWSFWVAPVLAVVGTAITRDARWGVACLIGAAYDVLTMRYAAGLAPSEENAHALDHRFIMVMLGRMVGKAVLIVAAVALPGILHTWGMAVGVLTVEITMMTVGVAVTAVRTFGSRPTG